MDRPAGAAVAALAVAATGLGASDQTGGTLVARLNVNQELPQPNARNGTGSFTGTIRGGRLTWTLRFSGLTGPAGAAHIHLALAGAANPVPTVPLCGPCRSGQRGTAPVTAAVARRILRGGAYVNIHTGRNKAGEVRGQIASS